MSQYATFTQFLGPGGVPKETLQSATPPVTQNEVEEELKAASEYFDSKVAIRYHGRVPLAKWPKLVQKAVIAIAAEKIMSTRVGYNPDANDDGDGDNSFEKAQKFYVDWIEDVADGRAFIPGYLEPEQKADYDVPVFVSGQANRGINPECDDPLRSFFYSPPRGT